MGHSWPLFRLFSSFSNILKNKSCRLSRIWTWIAGVECKHAEHLTTTTARGQAKVTFKYSNMLLLRHRLQDKELHFIFSSLRSLCPYCLFQASTFCCVWSLLFLMKLFPLSDFEPWVKSSIPRVPLMHLSQSSVLPSQLSLVQYLPTYVGIILRK